jgi:hypothetical protein
MAGLVCAMAVQAAETPPSESAVQAPARTQQPVYKSIWRQDAEDNIVHLQSGLACDSALGEWHRTSVYAYKPSGLDVSCNYLDPQERFITMYLTRRENRTLSDDFAEARREFLETHPDAALHAPSSGVPDGFLAEFYLRDAGRTREGIWVRDLDGWTLEYRATWKDNDAAMFDGISLLTRRAEETAGGQLSLCAKTPEPVRDGTAVMDKQEISNTLMMQSLLGGGAALAGEKPAADEKPLLWCAVGMVGPSDANLMLWRAILSDGTDAGSDKITPATVDEPPALMSETNPLADFVQASNDTSNQPRKKRWAVTLTDGNQVWIFALYDGRPPADALGTLAFQVASDKLKPLGGYQIDGKNITINLPDTK